MESFILQVEISNIIIAQYMIYFSESWCYDPESIISSALQQKVFHRFGEGNVRVSHLQNFKNKKSRKWYDYRNVVVSAVLLFAPQVYYRELQRTHEGLITLEEWKPFFDGVKDDWTAIVINVCFLPCFCMEAALYT